MITMSMISCVLRRRLLHEFKPYYSYSRCYGSTPEPDHRKSRSKAGKVKAFAQTKYLGVLQRYMDRNRQALEQKLEKRWPKAFKLYKQFTVGMAQFWTGFKQYSVISLGLKELHECTRVELDNYRQVPSDVLHVSPVLFLSTLPGTTVLVLPLAYYFPKHLLSRQWWTPEQRLQFGTERLHRRLVLYPKLYKFLHSEAAHIRDPGLQKVFIDILAKLKRGEQTSVEEILEVKDVFTTKPLGFSALYSRHPIHMQWNLSRSWSFPGRKNKMAEHAQLLNHSNMAIAREGCDSMSKEDLQLACLYRGLLPTDLSEEELRHHLSAWAQLSQHINESSLSLLLHSHVLLSYSHPNTTKYLTSVRHTTVSDS